MASTIILAAAVILLSVLGLVSYRWWTYRGARLITCPENDMPAGVRVDALAAVRNPFRTRPALHLSACSRWPEKAGCGQMCLSQIESSPDGCMVSNLLAHWYGGKNCVVCRQPFGEIHFTDHKPMLLSPLWKLVQWNEVATETLPDVLATHQPVCWNCGTVMTFLREHPELVTDRARPA